MSELIDALTIATIKLCVMGKSPPMEYIDFDNQETEVAKAIADLAVVNYEVFKAVDIVAESTDVYVTAEAAKKAQTLNLLRSQLKKAIDEYFHTESKEVKI